MNGDGLDIRDLFDGDDVGPFADAVERISRAVELNGADFLTFSILLPEHVVENLDLIDMEEVYAQALAGEISCTLMVACNFDDFMLDDNW